MKNFNEINQNKSTKSSTVYQVTIGDKVVNVGSHIGMVNKVLSDLEDAKVLSIDEISDMKCGSYDLGGGFDKNLSQKEIGDILKKNGDNLRYSSKWMLTKYNFVLCSQWTPKTIETFLVDLKSKINAKINFKVELLGENPKVLVETKLEEQTKKVIKK